jgi:L-cystine transport system substrate-binding protein
MKKLAVVLSIIFVALLCAYGGQTASADNSGEKKIEIRIGTNILPNPPFSYTDDDGNPVGYTIDYLKELAKQLPEYDFVLNPVDTQAMLLGVDSSKYAFAANFYFKNPEREKKYLFADTPYGYSVPVLIVRFQRDDIQSLEDLHGKKLVPITPNSGLYYILKDYNIKNPGREVDNIEIIDAITNVDALKYVASGQYDAFFTNLNIFNDNNQYLNLDLKVGGIVSKEPVWILFNRNQTELRDKFEKATRELIADGTLVKLSEKYFDLNFFQSIEELRQGYSFRK